MPSARLNAHGASKRERGPFDPPRNAYGSTRCARRRLERAQWHRRGVDLPRQPNSRAGRLRRNHRLGRRAADNARRAQARRRKHSHPRLAVRGRQAHLARRTPTRRRISEHQAGDSRSVVSRDRRFARHRPRNRRTTRLGRLACLRHREEHVSASGVRCCPPVRPSAQPSALTRVQGRRSRHCQPPRGNRRHPLAQRWTHGRDRGQRRDSSSWHLRGHADRSNDGADGDELLRRAQHNPRSTSSPPSKPRPDRRHIQRCSRVRNAGPIGLQRFEVRARRMG